MKFRGERDALADAVAWTAKSLPNRPSVPVLAGVMMRVTDGQLNVSGFDYEVSSQVTVDIQGDADGAALVSGRLLAEITKALPAKPVDIAAVGVRIELNGTTLAMLATDRYRLALREMEWNPQDRDISLNALVPARTLNDTA